MKRDFYTKLLEWKQSEDRKPLILKGARQVGKTYILKEFGKNEYANTAYFNFEEDPTLKDFFTGRLQPERIIEIPGGGATKRQCCKNFQESILRNRFTSAGF